MFWEFQRGLKWFQVVLYMLHVEKNHLKDRPKQLNQSGRVCFRIICLEQDYYLFKMAQYMCDVSMPQYLQHVGDASWLKLRGSISAVNGDCRAAALRMNDDDDVGDDDAMLRTRSQSIAICFNYQQIKHQWSQPVCIGNSWTASFFPKQCSNVSEQKNTWFLDGLRLQAGVAGSR